MRIEALKKAQVRACARKTSIQGVYHENIQHSNSS
nr:MAG TPA: hypothetical protein [Caudoviricetes sp.]